MISATDLTPQKKKAIPMKLIHIVGIVAAASLLTLVPSSCANSKPERAEAAAREFSTHIEDATGTACAQRDTDNDGYCSCTVFRKDHDPMRIDCGCERWCIFNCATGCKVVQGVKGVK